MPLLESARAPAEAAVGLTMTITGYGDIDETSGSRNHRSNKATSNTGGDEVHKLSYRTEFFAIGYTGTHRAMAIYSRVETFPKNWSTKVGTENGYRPSPFKPSCSAPDASRTVGKI